jgi:isopenicillin-N N-acyltransferase-like protein
MTLPPEIPLIRVEGGHRDVGIQIGRATAESVRRRAALADGRVLEAAEPYRRVTEEELPWLVEELDGVAEGAGVEPMAVFASCIEELSDLYPEEIEAVGTGCSDMVACPPATPDGKLWVGHNNDLPASTEPEVVAIEWRVAGDPVVFTIGIGPWISVGFNSAGLSLTGNEVSPNDERVGIPRLLQVRDMLRRTTLEDAVRAALHPRRASSYNNVLSHRDGGVVNVEGSATDAELLRPGPEGTLAHTNHYVSERMRRYEGDPAYATRSDVRYRRALTWLAPGGVTPSLLRTALSDHSGEVDAICRHPQAGSQTKTIFWCIANVTDGKLLYGRGNPCNSIEQRYDF